MKIITRFCIWLTFIFLLVCGHANALDDRRLCWQTVCAGMTMKQVKSQLAVQGFTVHDSWINRWIQRTFLSKLGGSREYERYIESITADRGAVCDPIPMRRRLPCASLELLLVRFPSGRRRLISIQGAKSIPSGRLASSVIADLQKTLGPPDNAEWKEMPSGNSVYKKWTYWSGQWDGKHAGSWLQVKINLVKAENVKDGGLSPPTLEDTVHVGSIDYSLYARWVGRDAESAWHGEKAGWSKDPRTGCRLWNNYPKASDSVRWNGECVNGYASGKGEALWSSYGGEYESDKGEFRNGKLNGHAVITLKDGRRFDGEFRNNLPDGPGTLTMDGDTYSGSWQKGCFNNDGKRVAFFTDRDKCNNF